MTAIMHRSALPGVLQVSEESALLKSMNGIIPVCLAHSNATCKDGNDGGRLLRMALMCGREATAVPSTTSITTSPSIQGTSCAAQLCTLKPNAS